MQMQVQMAVNVIERKAGGMKPVKLRVDFVAELPAQAAIEKNSGSRSRRDFQKIRRAD